MEDVLDVYERPLDLDRPVVCLDERPCYLIGDKREVIPAKPGQLSRFDYEYVRNGTATVFGLFAPLLGWQEMIVTERRTRIDFAACLKRLVDEFFPNAEKIIVVLDNLNTHSKASLYEAFTPAEASRIASRLEFHHTPKHGSWLNAVEIEFAALSRQCLDRRIPDLVMLAGEVQVWTVERNARQVKVDWQFRTVDARVKLARLYPSNVT
jgi:DDE superfamily endonuclease